MCSSRWRTNGACRGIMFPLLTVARGYNSNNLKESPADAGFDPAEKFRCDQGNENDGGLLRHVYESDGLPRERGRIVAFEHNANYTYAAADITRGYNNGKAREVTRQFLYLRGQREFFVVFDRVEATRPEFRRHFFLHVPTN